jgi:hypothetical protein
MNVRVAGTTVGLAGVGARGILLRGLVVARGAIDGLGLVCVGFLVWIVSDMAVKTVDSAMR